MKGQFHGESVEKTEVVTYTKENTKHSFYCDGCNEYLGETFECDDGWYQELGDFEFSLYLPGEWYHIKKCFCNDCRKKFLESVKNNLLKMGFEVDNGYG